MSALIVLNVFRILCRRVQYTFDARVVTGRILTETSQAPHRCSIRFVKGSFRCHK